MSGIYDRLRAQIGGDDDDQPPGVTPLEIADLPEAQRQLMFALLRDPQASTEGLTLAILQARSDNPEALPGILAELTKNGWLVQYGEPPGVRYKVNLRRKRGTSLTGGLWAYVTDRLDQENDEKVQRKTEDQDDSQHESGFPTMSNW
jgi:hypothetical protein